MTDEQFHKSLYERQRQCTNVLMSKSQEYSRHDDKLHNFKTAGRMQGTTPEEALRGMWLKHLVSIMDIVDDIEIEGVVPSKKLVDEKFTDTINYLHLLEALIVERMGK